MNTFSGNVGMQLGVPNKTANPCKEGIPTIASIPFGLFRLTLANMTKAPYPLPKLILTLYVAVAKSTRYQF